MHTIQFQGKEFVSVQSPFNSFQSGVINSIYCCKTNEETFETEWKIISSKGKPIYLYLFAQKQFFKTSTTSDIILLKLQNSVQNTFKMRAINKNLSNDLILENLSWSNSIKFHLPYLLPSLFIATTATNYCYTECILNNAYLPTPSKPSYCLALVPFPVAQRLYF